MLDALPDLADKAELLVDEEQESSVETEATQEPAAQTPDPEPYTPPEGF